MRTLSHNECCSVSGGTTRDEFAADYKANDELLAKQYLDANAENFVLDDTSPASLAAAFETAAAQYHLQLEDDPRSDPPIIAEAKQMLYDQTMISLMDQMGITDTSQHTFDIVDTSISKLDFSSLQMSDFDMVMLVTPTEVVVVDGPTPPTAGQLQDALTQANAGVNLDDLAGSFDELDADNGSDCSYDDGSAYTYGDDFEDDGVWNFAEDWIPEDGSTW